MCGIIGVLGPTARAPDPVAAVMAGLRRVEYRGYDSAGVAALSADGGLERRRAAGKLSALETRLAQSPIAGMAAIGHTRWATHGAPTEANAHPHAAPAGAPRCALVHNGIIENAAPLRARLEADGAVFESETDTEVVAHLIDQAMAARGLGPAAAFEAAVAELDGAFAIAALFAGEADLMAAARVGSPLAIGVEGGGGGADGAFIGSDAYALAPFANHIAYLEDGDWALVRRGGFEARRIGGGPVTRPVRIVDAASAHVDKGEHRHFMAKEIHEQPDVMAHALAAYVDPGAGTLRPAPLDFTAMTKLTIAACGTALYAGLVAKHWFEGLAALPVEVEAASELRYRNPLFPKGGGAIAISQSGETADTLQALRLAAEAEQSTLALVNVAQSSIARAADAVAEIHAGPEIGVASTKAFTCQLTALAALAGAAAKARGRLAADEEAAFVRALLETPRLMAEALAASDRIEALAHSIAPARDVLYIGRGLSHPLALEGALKLKEISYIHAEGYAAGELKHGPIALIDTDAPVVVIAPSDALFAKTISNAQEAAARGARIILIGDEAGARLAKENGWEAIEAPKSHPLLSPLVFAAPIQLLAYFVAVAKGTDVDQPRNLAKSVTVE